MTFREWIRFILAVIAVFALVLAVLFGVAALDDVGNAEVPAGASSAGSR
jgi:hypothetical protein